MGAPGLATRTSSEMARCLSCGSKTWESGPPVQRTASKVASLNLDKSTIDPAVICLTLACEPLALYLAFGKIQIGLGRIQKDHIVALLRQLECVATRSTAGIQQQAMPGKVFIEEMQGGVEFQPVVRILYQPVPFLHAPVPNKIPLPMNQSFLMIDGLSF